MPTLSPFCLWLNYRPYLKQGLCLRTNSQCLFQRHLIPSAKSLLSKLPAFLSLLDPSYHTFQTVISPSLKTAPHFTSSSRFCFIPLFHFTGKLLKGDVHTHSSLMTTQYNQAFTPPKLPNIPLQPFSCLPILLCHSPSASEQRLSLFWVLFPRK